MLGARPADEWQDLRDTLDRYVRRLPPSAEKPYIRDLVLYADVPAEWWRPLLTIGLDTYAAFLERHGAAAEALAFLRHEARVYGGRMPLREFPRLALAVGRLRRTIGDWDGALAAYGASARYGVLVGDRVTEIRARIGRARVVIHWGNYPAAETQLRACIADAAPLDSPWLSAMAHHDLATVLGKTGRMDAACHALYRAFELQSDDGERLHVLCDMALVLGKLGAADQARDVFAYLLKRAPWWDTRVNALLEWMELEIRAGHELRFRSLARQASAQEDRMPPSMAVDYRYKLALGHARFGDVDRAERLLEEAAVLAAQHRLGKWIFAVDELAKHIRAPDQTATTTPIPEAEIVRLGDEVVAALSPGH